MGEYSTGLNLYSPPNNIKPKQQMVIKTIRSKYGKVTGFDASLRLNKASLLQDPTVVEQGDYSVIVSLLKSKGYNDFTMSDLRIIGKRKAESLSNTSENFVIREVHYYLSNNTVIRVLSRITPEENRPDAEYMEYEYRVYMENQPVEPTSTIRIPRAKYKIVIAWVIVTIWICVLLNLCNTVIQSGRSPEVYIGVFFLLIILALFAFITIEFYKALTKRKSDD